MQRFKQKIANLFQLSVRDGKRILNVFVAQCREILLLHKLHSILLVTFTVLLTVFTTFHFLASLLGPDYVTAIVFVFLVSVVISHVFARSICTGGELQNRYWRAVDYPWVLAAFGTILISSGRYYIDQQRREVGDAELLLVQTGARLDSRCTETLANTAQMEATTREATKTALRECIYIKMPVLARDGKEHIELEQALGQLDETENRGSNLDRVAALLAIPSYLQPEEPRYLQDKAAVCDRMLSDAKLPKILVLSGITEGYFSAIEEDFMGELYTPVPRDKPYWRPTPYSLAIERSFWTDKILFCANVSMLQAVQKRVQSRAPARRFVDFISKDLPVWYLTLAVFAGVRLGKTAYDTRP